MIGRRSRSRRRPAAWTDRAGRYRVTCFGSARSKGWTVLNEERRSPDDTMPRQPDAEPDRMAQPVDDEQPPRLPFPVVGIGASAGGLEAVGEFLDAMRPDGGMAFVLIQHLSPDRESHMAE